MLIKFYFPFHAFPTLPHPSAWCMTISPHPELIHRQTHYAVTHGQGAILNAHSAIVNCIVNCDGSIPNCTWPINNGACATVESVESVNGARATENVNGARATENVSGAWVIDIVNVAIVNVAIVNVIVNGIDVVTVIMGIVNVIVNGTDVVIDVVIVVMGIVKMRLRGVDIMLDILVIVMRLIVMVGGANMLSGVNMLIVFIAIEIQIGLRIGVERVVEKVGVQRTTVIVVVAVGVQRTTVFVDAVFVQSVLDTATVIVPAIYLINWIKGTQGRQIPVPIYRNPKS
jgi:hypothetical protein